MIASLRSVAALSLGVLGLFACATVYPPVETAPPTAPPPASGSAPVAAAPGRGARFQLFSADDPQYEALAGDASGRSAPDAAERLLVMRDGEILLDLGIRSVPLEDQGKVPLQEQVALADDASAAVIVRTDRKAGAPEQTTITWLPAEDPGKAWRKVLEPGVRVPLALPIPRARGLAMVTGGVPNAPDDLRIYDPKGAQSFRMAGTPSRVTELRASTSGRFVAADLGYAARAGTPDRAVWVHDVASRTAWIHSWAYGADEEITAWRLLEDGTLEADSAEFRLVIGPGDRVVDRKRREM